MLRNGPISPSFWEFPTVSSFGACEIGPWLDCLGKYRHSTQNTFTIFIAIDESVTDGMSPQQRNSMKSKPHTVVMSSSDFTYLMYILAFFHPSSKQNQFWQYINTRTRTFQVEMFACMYYYKNTGILYYVFCTQCVWRSIHNVQIHTHTHCTRAAKHRYINSEYIK